MTTHPNIDEDNYDEDLSSGNSDEWKAECGDPEPERGWGIGPLYVLHVTGHQPRSPTSATYYCSNDPDGGLPDNSYTTYCHYNNIIVKNKVSAEIYRVYLNEECGYKVYYASDCTYQHYDYIAVENGYPSAYPAPTCESGERLYMYLTDDSGWGTTVYTTSSNAASISTAQVGFYEEFQIKDYDWGLAYVHHSDDSCPSDFYSPNNFYRRLRRRTYKFACTSEPCIDSDVPFINNDDYSYYPNSSGIHYLDESGYTDVTSFANEIGGVVEEAYINCEYYFRAAYIKSCIPCISITSDQIMQCQSSNIIRLSYNCDLVENYEIFLSYSGTVIDCNGNSKYAENGVDFVAPEHVVIPNGQNYVDIEFETIKKISGDINIEATSSNSIQCEVKTITVECDCNDSNDLCSDNFFWEKPGCADFFSSSDYYQFMIEDKG